jgi:hypothetical protein
MRPIKRNWATKPPVYTPINWSHPLTKGLIGCWLTNDGGGFGPTSTLTRCFFDSVGGNHASAKYSASSPIWTAGKFGGLAVRTTQTGGSEHGFTVTDKPIFHLTNAITVSARLKRSTDSGVSEGILGKWNATPSYLLYYEAGKYKFAIRVGGVNKVAATTNTYLDGKWHDVVGTFDGSVVKIYIDGNLEVVTGDSTSGPIDSSNDDLELFSFGNRTGWFKGDYEDVRIWSRALTPAEVIHLYSNPYGMFVLSKNSALPFVVLGVHLRPISDISTGGWTTSPLYSKINEVSPDDSNYIRSADNPLYDTCEVALTPTGTPISRTNHNIRYRIQNTVSGNLINLVVALYQGSNLIGSGVHNNVANGFFTTGFLLTTGQASNITDYSNLRLRFIASTGGF